MYGRAEKPPGDERRYSPRAITGITKNVIAGNPRHADISTSLIERQNLTIRMGIRRFTRLTNAFSKKARNHVHHTALWFTYYNWCRIHRTLRVTPAIAAGLTDEVYDIDWIVDLIENRTPPPGPRGPYRKHKRPLRTFRNAERRMVKTWMQ